MDQDLCSAEFFDEIGNLRFRILTENYFGGCVILKIKHGVFKKRLAVA
jgi:hypothetical protein